MHEVEFKSRKPNIQKLLAFGFKEQENCYTYAADLLDGQMQMTVTVSKDNKVSAKVVDCSSGEEYVLHLVQSAVGAFVGQVRAEYQGKLNEISEKCFDTEVFKSVQAKSVIAYVKEKYGDELEFLWKKSDNAIVRRRDNKNWYAAFLTVPRCKIGIHSDAMVEILDLRMKPEDVEVMVDNKKYFPGYHMNKKHWITVCLDETVSFDEICSKIDDSYKLAMK